ncbi:pseudouridine synthase [Solicola gregarius]|uniref:Pseudouridine synthase n=1 Tax=Solicola gregarius TaxID=2908642 RepID=A0AA46TH51_9ACTN|nr:pseudouridine synthase [Solicola gregarius]UYM05185.1 rRNA pseudouridine synthase [Solicola gregarius]
MNAEPVRLQKVLAQAGIASRRHSETLIAQGRVEVDGEIVIQMGIRVDPATAVIRVDGKRLPPASANAYVVLNKPLGVVSAMSDPRGRPTLAAYVESRAERLFHVGRLDADTEGLLLLTNDGEFAHRMAHPSYEIAKVYVAEVDGRVQNKTATRLRTGVDLDDGPIAADAFKITQVHDDRSLVRLTIHEGRNRIVRRMLAEVGHPVRRLSRVAIGDVRLGSLKPGDLRDLSADELGGLLDSVGL